MSLSDDLLWRGLIKDKTFTDNSFLDDPKSFYLGIDASADSLTVGNLAIILLARRLADAGWNAVLLMGGGTSLVGDPGGKKEERQLKSEDEVKKNIEGVKEQVTRLFSGERFSMVNNLDWLSGLKYLEFLRDVGKHFSMTEMMQREFVTERMNEGGAGISYAEFSYSLIQGYDFWHLFNGDHKTVLQIGGSDQWGNMLSGVALIRKKEGKEAHALSMPLVVNKETGQKFGKSEGGAIWLDSQKTSVNQFRQFWINVSDEDVEDYLKIFTFLPKERIDGIMRTHRQRPELRVAQNELSLAVTEVVHRENSDGFDVREALKQDSIPRNLPDKCLEELRRDFGHAKSTNDGSIAKALVDSGLVLSNTEAKRLLANGAVYINGHQVTRENFDPRDFEKSDGRLLLRKGKNKSNSALVELE